MVSPSKPLLGSYITMESSKRGINTSVRRSTRNRKETHVVKKEKGEVKKENREVKKENGEVKKENGEVKKEGISVDDLSSIFQTTLVVDNASLKVIESKTEMVSPLPKDGRYIAMNISNNNITPVKRSNRVSLDGTKRNRKSV